MVGSQKQHGIGDVLRRAKAAERGLRFKRLARFFGQGAGHVGVNKAGGNAVHRDAAAAHFARQRFAEPLQRGFGGGVVSLPCVAHCADHGGDGDDAPRALFHHAAQHGFGRAINGFEVHVHNLVPFFFFHAHQQVVARDARVVHQNIQFAEFFFHVGNQRFHAVGRGGVERAPCAVPRGEALGNGACAAFAGGGADNGGTCLGEGVGNRRANAA